MGGVTATCAPSAPPCSRSAGPAAAPAGAWRARPSQAGHAQAEAAPSADPTARHRMGRMTTTKRIGMIKGLFTKNEHNRMRNCHHQTGAG